MTSSVSRLVHVAIAFALTAPPLLAMQQDSSEAHVVIKVDSLDRATFVSVAELLQARVPGLTITRDGDRGLHWYMRGQASFSGSEPLVLVDDMRLAVGPASNSEFASRPTPLDEIDVEDVERIEVMSGPAVAASYGTGAANGVIRIFTFAPRAQETTWRLYTSAGAIDDNVKYPAIYTRPGSFSNGGTTSQCTLWWEAMDVCTPTGPITAVNLLETESPFERALAARVGGAVSSMTGRIAWRGGATFDREGSTAGHLASQRLHVHGGGSLSPTSSTDATVRAYWTRGDADLPSDLVPSLLIQGIFPLDLPGWSGFTRPPSSDYDSERYGVTANARWQMASWLGSQFAIGSGRFTDEDDLESVLDGGFPRTVTWRGERRRRDLTARAELTTTYGAGAIRGVSTMTLERADSRAEEEGRNSVRDEDGRTVFLQTFGSNIKTEISGLDLTQRADLWGRATITAGVRVDRVDIGGTNWHSPPYPHASVTWDVRRSSPSALGGIRLRAALGDAGNVPRNLGLVFVPIGGSSEPNVELTREREAGLDLEAAHDRLGLSLTWYVKRTSDVPVFTTSPFPPQFTHVEVLNRGIEATLRAHVIATSRLAWDVRLGYAYNHNELRRLEGPPFSLAAGPFTRQFVALSAPVAAHRYAQVTAVEDLDGDGRFDDACRVDVGGCEVLVGPTEFRPAFPPTVANLETTVRIGSVTIGALFDHRGGHYRGNATETARCLEACLPAYDAGLPARDQARVAALHYGFEELFVEDATFTKLRELWLRVSAPTRWAEAFGASRLDISFAGRNVATWTRYSGLDPEAISQSGLPVLYPDFAATPVPRRFSLRITATK